MNKTTALLALLAALGAGAVPDAPPATATNAPAVPPPATATNAPAVPLLAALGAVPDAPPAAATNAPAVPPQVTATNAPAVPPPAAVPPAPADDRTDEIDLEEDDDAALAAKRPRVKPTDEKGPVSLVDIDCDEATIADVLRQFRKTTGANIISGESTNYQRRVSVTLRRVPWLQALTSILGSRGFRLDERDGIYRVAEDLQAIPLQTTTFALNHASAKELADLFNGTYARKDAAGKPLHPIATCFEGANVVVVTADEKTLSDCARIVKAVDHAVAQIYIEARFLELSSEAMHKLGMNWQQLRSWSVSARALKAGVESNHGRAAVYDSKASYTRKEWVKTGEQRQTSAETNSKTDTYTDIADGSPGIAKSVLVPDKINEAAGAGLSAASMAWRRAGGFSGQLSADDFTLALSAFEEFGEGKIFSNPKIIVSNGKEAKVDMTTKEPNVTVDANYTGTSSQNLSISTKLEVIPGEDKQMFAKEAFFSYGIELSVKPRISPDGLISVEIVPTISEKTDEKTIAGAGEAIYTSYPIISVKRLTTEFTMKDGSTAVIGGLTQTVEDDVDSGIPYLRKIPWVGPKLFGWKSRQKVQKEIIVCVTIGIANPAELPEDVGLPKNAVLGREYLTGARQEPGARDGKAREVLRLDMRPLDERKHEHAGTVSVRAVR